METLRVSAAPWCPRCVRIAIRTVLAVSRRSCCRGKMSEKCLIEMVQDSSAAKKFCKTLDNQPADDNKRNDNLYMAVRQCLHKVHRLSQSSLSPLKSPRPVAGKEKGSGVSQESSIGKFYAIMAFFDRNNQKIKKSGSRSNRTILSRMASAVVSNDHGSSSDK
ncbi:uncharacterized protein LOC143360741 [Halictus rubicundus]|uniref:uncharacterized protein LOC143360741 n=1 Tax=Halictus rubicundus TaxID=77578 RepID=UPI00403627EC